MPNVIANLSAAIEGIYNITPGAIKRQTHIQCYRRNVFICNCNYHFINYRISLCNVTNDEQCCWNKLSVISNEGGEKETERGRDRDSCPVFFLFFFFSFANDDGWFDGLAIALDDISSKSVDTKAEN